MYGTGREKLFKDQGFYSQDLHVCSLEINEYFNVLTTTFECLHQIYMLMQPSAKWVYSITLLYITLHPPFHTKRLMCKDHIRGSFPTCLKELKLFLEGGGGYSLIWFITFCLKQGIFAWPNVFKTG